MSLLTISLIQAHHNRGYWYSVIKDTSGLRDKVIWSSDQQRKKKDAISQAEHKLKQLENK